MSRKLSYAQSMDETLPEGWGWSTLGDVADVLAGNPAPQGEVFFAGGKYPFVRVQDMGRMGGATKLNATNDYINDKAVKGLRLFPKGSVLFTKSGASTLLNQRAMLGSDMYVVSHIAVAIPKDGVLSEWVYYWLRTVDFAYLAHATTLPSLPLSKAKEIPVPVAPLDQQKRIIAEIEKQFSRLDEAVANLKRVKANLKRYKAAVLKAAVEGRLVETEAEIARREGRNYETGAQLLQRILETRRSQWNGKGKYKEPAAPDTTDLPELPEGWVWSNFETAADRVTVGHVGSMKDEYVEQGVPFLRSQNVRANRYDPEGLKLISQEFHRQLGKSTLRPGDIVVVRSGSVGVSCVIPDHLTEANCSDLVIIKEPRGVLPHYGAYYMNSVVETRVAAGKVGVALTHFNTQSVAELPLPVPPMAEQLRIVAEVDRRLSVAREVEVQVDANYSREGYLRQSLLKAAFSGYCAFMETGNSRDNQKKRIDGISE